MKIEAQNKLKSKNRRLKKIKRKNVWDNIKVHQVMLQDKIRTLAYKKAIENTVQCNDVVMDLGCGSGILSFFAVKKGCKKVYAIDSSDIIDIAAETAKINRLDKSIVFIKRDIFSFIPKDKINVLVHEQIGSFLWDEDLVSKVAYVRDNLLQKDGLIIPFKIDLFLVPSSALSSFNKSLLFWAKKPYGFDFRDFLQQARKKLKPQLVELKNTKTFLCKPKLAYSVDLRKENKIPHKIAVSFILQKDVILGGICAYIKVHLDETHFFSTKPSKRISHWGQIFLPFVGNGTIRRNSALHFTLYPKKKREEWKFKFELE